MNNFLERASHSGDLFIVILFFLFAAVHCTWSLMFRARLDCVCSGTLYLVILVLGGI